jgi:superfamily II DNA/RNA helicase
MKFSDLGLSERVLAAVEASGYTTPTPIQAQAIPEVLKRRDVLGIAQTGTGKTAAFTLPMLSILGNGRARARMPRTLILEPTRELAAQVEENFMKYSADQKLSVALLIGGVSFGDQDMKITRGVDVLIATPGRLLDHFERGKLLLTGIDILVIDEADRMLDMGFIPDIERICKLVPFTRQTLFFTATMPPEIQRITEQFLSNPVRIEVARTSSTAPNITQKLVASGGRDFEKRDTLRRIIKAQENFKNAIIFSNRKVDVATLCRSLQRHGFNAAAIHGDLDQPARMAALESFRSGQTALLVASDVAARGLDIPDVSHVFNYDLPIHAEDYVHRIGRTGRAGKHGTAISVVAKEDRKYLQAILSLTKNDIPWDGPTIDEFVPPPVDENYQPRRGRDRDRKPRLPRERKRDYAPKRESSEPLATDAAMEPIAAGAAPIREEREPRRERRPRAERPPREEKARTERPARQERSREDAPAENVVRLADRAPRREDRPARNDRRDRREDREPTPQGLGDHVPSFLMRPAKVK